MTNRAKIVTITSRKGGVGKTVSTSLLARYFTEVEGKKVVVIDFDGRGGITSVLHNNPIQDQELSISEVLVSAFEQGNVRRVFEQALIDTGLAKSKHWQDNGGTLYLIPSKPSLDNILSGKNSSLLRIALHNLGLSEEYIVLIDTGSDSNSVLAGVGAADVVFLPLKFSRQDVHPAVETLRTIIMEQKGNGTAALGGLIVNQASDAKWEQEYINRYAQLFESFKSKTSLVSASDDLFIHLNHSRLVQRGVYLDWSFRESFYETAKKMADAVHAVDVKQQRAA